MHDCQDLIRLFKLCFAETHQTELVRGEAEPMYLPATQTQTYHAVIFAHGFFASALHECAHWFIAGEARRQEVDYGYWYLPDGRNVQEQKLFLQVEKKPQAIEWILSKACGFPFRISIDNLKGDCNEADESYFKALVYQQVIHYCTSGLPPRAECFRKALCHFYQIAPALDASQFNLEELEAFA